VVLFFCFLGGVEDDEVVEVAFVFGDLVGGVGVLVGLEDLLAFFAVGVEVELGLVGDGEAGAVLVDSAEGGEEVGGGEVFGETHEWHPSVTNDGVVEGGFFVGGEGLGVGDVDLDVCFVGFGVVGEVEVGGDVLGDELGGFRVGGCNLEGEEAGVGFGSFDGEAVLHGFGPLGWLFVLGFIVVGFMVVSRS